MRALAAIVCLVLFGAIFSNAARAWSLKTHVWIAQEVLNDVVPDGKVSIAGKEFSVPSHVVNALRMHPDRYRMGHMGPDVFPDPVVGQVTTHPGLKGGWQTDDWLKHLMRRASTPEEIAFAFGFTGHAAGDIFAHSYVNLYAGDIFELSDEREIERRHFLLEKYIESRTPMPRTLVGVPLDWRADLATATTYLRDTLILNNGASGQNARAKYGIHLSSMNEVYNAVGKVQDETQKVIERLTSWAADYIKKQIEVQVQLATGKLQLEAAEASLRLQLETVRIKRELLDAALKAKDEAIEFVERYPVVLNAQLELIAIQAQVLVEATATATRVAAEVIAQLNNLQNRLRDLRGEAGRFACNVLIFKNAIRACQRGVDRVNNAISDVERLISGENLRLAAANEARNIAERNRDGTLRAIENLRSRLAQAQRDIASGAFDLAISAARASLDVEEKILQTAQKAVAELKKIQEKIENELLRINDLVDIGKRAIDRYNILTLLIENWRSDIRTSTEQYIKASDRAGLKMLTNSGNPIGEYIDWFGCYGQVFLAQPKQIGEVGCLLKQFLEDVKSEYNKVIDSLPEILRWIIAPSREIEKIVRQKVQPELEKAGVRILGFIYDPITVDFLRLLADPESASQDALNAAYRVDGTTKRLLTFDRVSDLIDQDFPSDSGSAPDPYRFEALKHAVTLAKISLLGSNELNELIRSFVGEYTSPKYGSAVYQSTEPNFSILFDVVRSIDGNHQWQAFGLPYPRKIPTVPKLGDQYGHNHADDASKGLRIWVDPYLRERVFLALFPTSIVGMIGKRPEMEWDRYKFPACAAHPFPISQLVSGAAAPEDKLCVTTAAPNEPRATPDWADVAEYRERNFRCQAAVTGERHWVIVASPTTHRAALRKAEEIRAANPDIHVEAWQPTGRGRYWPVMVAACTDTESARKARDIAVRRGIARDAYIWRPHTPWQPIARPLADRSDNATKRRRAA